MTAIRAGILRQRITLQAPVITTGEIGGPLKTWASVATVWADINPLTGRERLQAAALKSEVSHEITIRWQAALADPQAVAAMRIVFGTRIFNIHASMNQDERNRVLVLLASEGMNDG